MYVSFICSEVTYQLILHVTGPGLFLQLLCDGIEESREAIEFSIRGDDSRDGRWIPLMLSYYDASVASTNSTTVVRGYKILVQFGQDASTTVNIVVCGDVLLTNEVQFRWMGTANLNQFNLFRSDMWALASVNAVLITQDERITLLQDNFGGNTLE